MAWRPPAWLVYPSAAALLLMLALGLREHADAPAPPPPPSAAERAVLSETAPIDPALAVRVRDRRGLDAATAVSVGDNGVWLSSRRALAACAQPAIMVGDTDGIRVASAPSSGEVVALTTASGAPALPIAGEAPQPGSLAFVAGFPRGRPGELALRYLGRLTTRARTRQTPGRTVLVWAEAGRTEGLHGDLAGIEGAPVLDVAGQVMAVTLGEAPRRGRVYTSTREDLATALAAAKPRRAAQAAGTSMTPDNYGLAADDLRRALRIAPVACLKG